MKMRSLPNAPALMTLPSFAAAPGVLPADNAATAQPWQPEALNTAATPPVPTEKFERTQESGPAWASFEVSRKVGIPDDVLEEARARARSAGYATGWAAGEREAAAAGQRQRAEQQIAFDQALEQFAVQRSTALAALDTASKSLHDRTVTSATDIEQQILLLAFDIAQALVGDVMADHRLRADAALQRALQLAPQDHDVTVKVATDDFATLAEEASAATAPSAADSPAMEHRGNTLTFAHGANEITIVPDTSLAPGDAVAVSGTTTIDARMSTALERVREVIGS